jgi:Protein of unknown function (DUF3795)
MGEDNLKMTAYCGLYCGSCAFNKGIINDLAMQIVKEFDEIRLDKIVEVIPFLDAEKYKQAREFLEMIGPMKCPGCKEGPVSQFCEVAKCVREKGIEGCWKCSEFSACSKMDFLAHVHGDAHIKNMEKINEVGLDKWIEEGPLW